MAGLANLGGAVATPDDACSDRETAKSVRPQARRLDVGVCRSNHHGLHRSERRRWDHAECIVVMSSHGGEHPAGESEVDDMIRELETRWSQSPTTKRLDRIVSEPSGSDTIDWYVSRA